MAGKFCIKEASEESNVSTFQKLELERIRVNNEWGFLLTIDGERTALSDPDYLLELIHAEVFRGATQKDPLEQYRKPECIQTLTNPEYIISEPETGTDKITCPECGSKNTRNFGNRYSESGSKQTRGCNECGYKYRYDPSAEKLITELKPPAVDETTNVEQLPITCPKCGSKKTIKNGVRWNKGGGKPKRKCLDCHWIYTKAVWEGTWRKFSKEIEVDVLTLIGKKPYHEIVKEIKRKYGKIISEGQISIWKNKHFRATVAVPALEPASGMKPVKPELVRPMEKQDRTPVIEPASVNEPQDIQTVCPICNGSHTNKNNKDTDGQQRYWCFSCDKSFREDVGGTAPEGTECPICESSDCICWGKKEMKNGIKQRYLCKVCKNKFSSNFIPKLDQKISEPEPEKKVMEPEPESEPESEKKVMEPEPESEPEPEPELLVIEPVLKKFEPSKQQLQIIMNLVRESISITGKVSAEKIALKTGIDVYNVAKILMDNKAEIGRATDNYEESKFEIKLHTDTRVLGKDYG